MFNTNSMVTPLKYNNSIILDVQPGISTLTTNVLLQVILSYTSNATLAADLSFVNFMLAPSNTTVHPIQQFITSTSPVITTTLLSNTSTYTTRMTTISSSTTAFSTTSSTTKLTSTPPTLPNQVSIVILFLIDLPFAPILRDQSTPNFKSLLNAFNLYVIIFYIFILFSN